MDLVVHPSCQTPRPLLSPARPPSSWVSPKNTSKAPELSLLQTPQVVKVGRQKRRFCFDMVKTMCVWFFFFLGSLTVFLGIFCYVVAEVHSFCSYSASSGHSGVWPCVLSLHSTVNFTQQPEAHAGGHPICFSRTLHYPPTAQQRQPDHVHWRSRSF